MKKPKERESRLTGEADEGRSLYEEIAAGIAASCLGNKLVSDLHQKHHFSEVRHHLDQVEAFTSLPEER